MSVEIAMLAGVSWRKNSLSYSDERKSSEATDIAGVSAPNRFSNAYFGFKDPEFNII